MAIEIVDFPIKNGDFPVRYVSHYQEVLELGQWIHLVPLLECQSFSSFLDFDDSMIVRLGLHVLEILGFHRQDASHSVSRKLSIGLQEA